VELKYTVEGRFSEVEMFGKAIGPKNNKLDFILLDLLNLFIAPLGGGAGAYVAYYFASSHHWNAGQIGMLLSIMAMCLAGAQIPAGLIIDHFPKRNQITALALGVIAISWLSMLIFPLQPVVLVSQVLIGLSCAFFAPALASITLGLVGYEGLEHRLGRNGIFSHIGNMVTAVLVGLCTAYLSGQAIIGLLIFFSLLAALSALGIRRQAPIINNASAKSLAQDCGERFHPLLKGLQGLFSTRGSRIFAIAALMYTFANASMLPLMVQLISKQGASAAAVQLPSSLLLTELVMIPVCFLASKYARLGRRPLLILSYLFLVLRGLGFTFIKTPAMMVAMQILDGMSAGIFGLVVTLVIADFCRHNNRFNSTLAALYMVLTLANGLSEFSSGMLANNFGFSTAFAILTVIATVGLVIIVALLPETRQASESILAESKNGLSVAATET